jgi:prepilin-type N-terminal cleavage/methylation domain-containing protein
MECPRSSSGFTLVELMIVVLIIGILVSIVVPVFTRSASDAEAKSCQSNQRTISGATRLLIIEGDGSAAASAGQLSSGGSGWYALLVPTWIKAKPTCPKDGANYLMDVAGDIMGDRGESPGFKASPDHKAP